MEGADRAPRLDDINRMLDSLTTNLQACDRREEDARQRHAAKLAPAGRRRPSHGAGDDVVIEFDAPAFAARPPRADDPMVVLVDPHGAQPNASHVSLMVPPPPLPSKAQPPLYTATGTGASAEAPIIVCAGDLPSNVTNRARATASTAYASGGSRAHADGLGAAVDDTEPWAAPGEWWDTGVRCVFEWLREAFAAALDRDARHILSQSGVSQFYAWPPVNGAEATAGGASAACSLTLMLRPWTPANRPADAQRGRGGGPCGIEARRRDAGRDLDALTASAERVIARVEASGSALTDRHAALSEAVRGCAACLRTLLRLAHDETDVLRVHGAATREAAVIATRAVGIAQKWIYARAVERVAHAAERYGTLDDALRCDFAHAQDAVRGQRARFLALWRDLKVRYDAFLADAGLDGADPAAAQAMEALFWRGAGGEPPVDPGSGDDPAVAVAAAAAHERGADPDAFDADALRLLRHYCEHMASVARSMLDRATDDDGDDDDGDDGDGDDADCGWDGGDADGVDNDDHKYDKHGTVSRQQQRRRRHVNRRRRSTVNRSAVDDAVSSVSSETRRRIAACVAGGDDRARILAEMRRARDQCRDLARQIISRRRERARLLRPVRRRHARRMRRALAGPCARGGDDVRRDADPFDRNGVRGPYRAARHSCYDPYDNNNNNGRGVHRGRDRCATESDGDDHQEEEEENEEDDLFLSSTLSSSDDDDNRDDDGNDIDRSDPRQGVRDARATHRPYGAPAAPRHCAPHARRDAANNGDDDGDDDGDDKDGHGDGTQAKADRRRLEAAMAADAADARAEAAARKRLAHIEALMAGMAAQAVESGPHAEWTRATARLSDALAEAQDAWRKAAEARASREAVLEEETARCLESVAATARAAHESDVGAVLCQWNERQHGIDRRRAEDLRQIAMARRVADEWLANFERKMVYYHDDVACAEAVSAVSEFRAIMGLHAAARGTLVRLAEFADAYEDLAYAWTLAYKIEYGDDDDGDARNGSGAAAATAMTTAPA
ncbi:hypothetical protein pneo_cds_516 [Pandoravirus neocaledonia]|uniref:Uncharacterized protein n=1 Tax=Pandoravirus neocaledonia TaxID=2107708 RepID=A0A2U7UCG3_9VIRU|nr:hypothetical protein pneo_cds_516 [Pandoravirus neocaledonia]AVK76123.1 hypothetical protein pneo_cds_516 [Pandoravirus neocaledonia]